MGTTFYLLFSWVSLRDGRKEKPYYQEHHSSIGKQKGCEERTQWLIITMHLLVIKVNK